MGVTSPTGDMQLGDLRLVRKIAAGGMAEVWEAQKLGVEGFEKRLAVKVVLPHLTENYEFIEMFLDEGRLAARMNHPNICQIVDLGQANDTYYMAMEYIDGVALSTVMKEAAKRSVFIPFEHCCQIMIGACSGLDYAHACTDSGGSPLNLVHRDISPQNIMLTFNGDAKVVDFGIAKAATKIHNTRAGVLKGKFAYMSPEQATGKPLDRRSDIFALGVVLWELSTGHRLFRADNEIATLHKIIGGDYPRPSEFRDDFPPELERIIFKALAINLDQRYQDCGEMQIDLEDFLMRHGMPAGSKRLGRYITWLMSDDDKPAPQSSSIVSYAFENSSGGLQHTPSSQLNAFGSSPSSQAVGSPKVGMNSAVSPGTMGGFVPTNDVNTAMFDENYEYSRRRKKRGGGSGLLIFLLLLLLGGGGAAAYFLMIKPPESQPLTPPKEVIWMIKSNPEGANIYVNGKFKGITPRVVTLPANQRYMLQLILRGHKGFSKEYEKLTENVAKQGINVTLQRSANNKSFGRLLLTVSKTKATVKVDNESLNPTFPGVYSQRLSTGDHVLMVKLRGYADYIKKFTLQENKELKLKVELKRKRRTATRDRFPAIRRPKRRNTEPRLPVLRRPIVARSIPSETSSWLTVTSAPAGAIVKIDGRMVGRTPLQRHKLKTGSHRISLSRTMYKSVSRSFRVTPNELKVLDFRLKSSVADGRPAKVSFGASPRSWVYVDGRRLGSTPLFNKTVAAGPHTIEFRTRKFRATHRKKVTLSGGQRAKFIHRFKTGKLMPLTRPGAKIYLNGEYLGRSNSGSHTVPSGTYTVRFAFDNGQSQTQRGIRIRTGDTKRIKAISR